MHCINIMLDSFLIDFVAGRGLCEREFQKAGCPPKSSTASVDGRTRGDTDSGRLGQLGGIPQSPPILSSAVPVYVSNIHFFRKPTNRKTDFGFVR